MRKILAFVLLILSSKAHTDNFFGEHAHGWHWYEQLPFLEEEAKVQDTQTKTAPKTPTELIKAYREELESRLHSAWINPSSKNLKAYQHMQKDMMDRSKLFSTSWMENVFQSPELDHTLVSPVNQQGRHLQIDLKKNQTSKEIENMAKEYGLFFFFSSDCPYCHQFAPIVKRFADTYGWDVIAISADGGGVAEFPTAEADNGLLQAWNVKALPSLFAVNPKTKEAIPIAHGLTSLDEMETRIMTLLGKKS